MNTDLQVAVVSSRDGYVSIIDLINHHNRRSGDYKYRMLDDDTDDDESIIQHSCDLILKAAVFSGRRRFARKIASGRRSRTARPRERRSVPEIYAVLAEVFCFNEIFKPSVTGFPGKKSLKVNV